MPVLIGSMRDAWSFSRRRRRRITSMFQRRYESTPLSQFTGSFAILPLLGRPKTIRTTPIVPILNALVSQTRVWPEILRGASPLLFWDEVSRTGERSFAIVHLACRGRFYMSAVSFSKILKWNVRYLNWVIRSKFTIDFSYIKLQIIKYTLKYFILLCLI